MREAEEVERLRLARLAALPVRCRKPSEFDQPDFLRVQVQSEFGESRLEIVKELLRVLLVLKSDHEIVRIAYDPRFAARDLRTPLAVEPQARHEVQESCWEFATSACKH